MLITDLDEFIDIEQKYNDGRAELNHLTEKFEKLLKEIDNKIKVARSGKGRIGNKMHT